LNTVSIQTRIDIESPVLKNIERFCILVLKELDVDNWEVSLLFCGEKYMRELNKRYRGIDSSTDVLSFPQEGGFDTHPVYYAGDIVISLEDCRRQAEERECSAEGELKQLIAHGLLHLRGFDHQSAREEKQMFEKQENIITKFKEVRIF
jgi:probable rRNA maturation factor